MGTIRDRARRGLSGAYGRLPLRAKIAASAGAHGELPVQQRARRALRSLQVAVGDVPGQGDVVQGSLLRPHRSVVVDRFDAWEHIESLKRAVVGCLESADVRVYALPLQGVPTLVIADGGWEAAWSALATDDRTRCLWVRAADRRAAPIPMFSAAPDTSTCEVFSYLSAPNGTLVADARLRVRVQRWTEVMTPDVPRPDGGSYEVGSLVRPRRNTFASHLPPPVLDVLERGQGEWIAGLEDVVTPVDVVYTWVDGSDPRWLAKRSLYAGDSTGVSDGQIAARFQNRDELRYSLRSVEMYAGWYNKIYLVTDDQVPDWLNVDHPRLEVVDHRDILDAADLPVFNSHAIESHLHRIAGLSESFIYMNDDVFLGRIVRPETFFGGNGTVKFYPSRALIDPGPPSPHDPSVTSAAKNNRALIESTFGRTFTNKLKHTPHPQSRDVLFEMEERFPDVFRNNARARFRSHSDHAILSGLAQRYAFATRRAVVGRLVYNYADISRPDLVPTLARWLRRREYDSFCLNDTGIREVSDEVLHDQVRSFLQAYFPFPSQFERDEPRL